MNETVILWILGGYAIAAAGFAGWAVLGALSNARDHAEMASSNADAHSGITSRLVKIETILALYGEKAAKILHSPHTPELDALLEKYCDRYYELTLQEWNRLREICDEIVGQPNQGKEVRALAAWLSTVAQHKLMLPPPHGNDVGL